MNSEIASQPIQAAPAKKRKKDSQHPTVRRLKTNELGRGAALLSQVKHWHANDPVQQVATFMAQFQIPAATGRRRRVSLETQENYRERMNTVVHTLRELNMPIRNLDEISSKQVRRVFAHLQAQGRSVSWMANINTTLRRFCIWIGKPDVCPPLTELLADPSASRRSIAAKTSKAWSTTPEEFEDIMRKVTAVCPMTALHLRLARLFGCRAQEMLMFRPAKAIQGEFIHLEEGTKGGRARMVPIETDEQKKWLDVALAMAEEDPKGRLIADEGLSLRQAIHHFYGVLRACGIDQKTEGVTAHGLRHSYACHIYEELTGEKAPIMGGGEVDKDLDQQARLDITRRLGHGRISVTNAYLGSHAALAKYARDNLKKIETQVKADDLLQSMMARSGLRTLCLVGPIASGATLGKSEIAVLAYAAKPTEGESQQEADRRLAAVAMDLAERLSVVLRRHFTVASLARLGEQPDQFELL